MRFPARSLLLLAAALIGACADPAPPVRPDVIFIVLDNVRADRLSQCGYERPTSPFLTNLCARDTGSCTCDAQAPSSWTLPTHASYFTGTEVAQHGAGKGGIGGGNVRLGPGTHARPLDGALPTLAETLGERGYQTIALSGNPLVSPASGLTRGFAIVEHATDFGKLYGESLLDKLAETLDRADPEEPLFLFVNIADAHRPWFDIPDHLDWLPPRTYLGFAQKPGKPNPERKKFVTGEMTPEESTKLLAHLDDVYDFAVRRADNTLRGVLRILEERGRVGAEPMSHGRGFRVVITSDHGEHLGDHGLMGHAGPYLFEEITRVPLAVWGSAATRELPRSISALVSYDLLLDGQLRRRPVRAAAFASDTWPLWYGPNVGSVPAAAIWHDGDKTVSHDGRFESFDLTADPAELAPGSATDPETVRDLEALLLALESSASGEPPDEEMIKLLESLGYL